MNVQGKVAIVTGASSGIGLATARLLSEKGTKLALAARSGDKLKQIAHELPNAIAIPTDMTKIDEINRMVQQTMQHFRRIDILVNNAGQGYDAPIEQIDPEVFRGIFDLDVVGPVVAMQQVIPIMRKQGEGIIINVSSGLAFMYLPGMSAYGALKRALVNISLTANEELKNDNIKVTVVYPYITLTDFEKNTIRAAQTQNEEAEAKQEEEEGGAPFNPDTAEHVAEKILQAIETEQPEVYAHDWMQKMSKEQTH